MTKGSLMRTAILTALCLALLLAGCAQNQTFLTTDQKLAKADDLYNRGKFSQAAELYGQVYFERASASAAHALFRQAECYFKDNKFPDARAVYEEFTETFPNSPDLSSAVFQIALCLYEESLGAQYDQTETLHAIDAFRKFIEKYPTDQRYADALNYIQKSQYKLIEKKYKLGYIYYKMKDYSAALMYFKEVTDLGNSNALDREAWYYSTLLLTKQGLTDKAREAYATLSAKYPGSKESKKLAKYFP